jgi:hypothetical protein
MSPSHLGNQARCPFRPDGSNDVCACGPCRGAVVETAPRCCRKCLPANPLVGHWHARVRSLGRYVNLRTKRPIADRFNK